MIDDLFNTPVAPTPKPPLLLIDGSYFLHRSFHGIPPRPTKSGMFTNSIYGVLGGLAKLIHRHQPTHMAITFDSSTPTFRHTLSSRYKAHRPPSNPKLGEQVPYLIKLLKSLNIPTLVIDGVEADDVLGTLAQWGPLNDTTVIISTGDKDLCQLVTKDILLEDSYRERVMSRLTVKERFGVTPEQIVDYLTLVGDTADGITGVPNIGHKGAMKLLCAYESIDNMMAQLDTLNGQVESIFKAGVESIPLNRQLATIVTNVPLDLTWDDLALKEHTTDRPIHDVHIDDCYHELGNGREGSASEMLESLVATLNYVIKN